MNTKVAGYVLVFTVLFGFCASFSWSQEQGRSTCTLQIDLHSVDAKTHQPIAGAMVSVDDNVVGFTDEAGHIFAGGLCEGVRTLRIERDEYSPRVLQRKIAGYGVEVIEVELSPMVEVITIQGKKIAPVEMQSISVLSDRDLERTRGKSLADAVADVPGVSRLGAGGTAAKPMIRGLYGQRIQLLMGQFQLRSQTWGQDHAPEIDVLHAGEIKIVRGAAGVRYGSGAMGGAIIVEPAPLREKPGLSAQTQLSSHLNGLGATLGGMLDFASGSIEGLAGRIEADTTQRMSPSSPDYALNNTAVHEWNAGMISRLQRGDGSLRLSYSRNQSELGVCSCLRFDSAEDFRNALESGMPTNSQLYQSDLRIQRPFQSVAHDFWSGVGEWTVPSWGLFSLRYAGQRDRRREYDTVRDPNAGPQFDFLLNTHEMQVGIEHRPLHLHEHLHAEGSAGISAVYEKNRYQGLPLIPDYRNLLAGVFAMERLRGERWEVELGVRADFLTRQAWLSRNDFSRMVRSGQFAEQDCGENGQPEVQCSSSFRLLSASLGGLLQVSPEWSLKSDLSTTARPPSADELYLNGTSPTFPVFGLGQPALNAEKAFSSSITSTTRKITWELEASLYGTWIQDYIYFSPALDAAGMPIFDVLVRGTFPRFQTQAVDAWFAGTDGQIKIFPLPRWGISGSWSIVRAGKKDGGYLPYVPPDRWKADIAYDTGDSDSKHANRVSTSVTYVRRQERFDPLADLAPPPSEYILLEAEASTSFELENNLYTVSVEGTNLLNQRYREYTSLLRYFADQPGWQAMARLSVRWGEPSD